MEASGKRYILHRSRTDRFRIWNLSDLHWLNRGCAKSDLLRDIREIAADPFSFWIGGGDYVDAIGYRDKRFDPDCVDPRITVAELGKIGHKGMEEVRDLFRPIAGKCLGLLLGNHELHLQLAKEQSQLHGWLCTELGVPNLGYCALFDVVFVRTAAVKSPRLQATPPDSHSETKAASFRVFAHHGAGFAQTPGGKLNRLIGFMQSFEADLYFCGHVHDHVARKEPTIGADASCTKLVQHVKLGLVSGSYLRTYTQGNIGYGEQRGYRPTSLGAAVATIHPETREMEAMV